MVQNNEGRGEREVSSGELNRYGDPQQGSQVRLWGVVTSDGEDLKCRPMSQNRGDFMSFDLLVNRRGALSFQVSLFGDLATQAGALLKRGMRLTVEGRLRKRTNSSGGRSNVSTDVVGWEVGIWDNECRVHWIQYEPNKGFMDGLVEALPGEQGSTISAADLPQRSQPVG